MKKLLLALLMIFTTFSVSSCNTFFEEEKLEITNIRKEIGKNEKGEAGFYIIIEYSNPDKLVDKFFVPDGKQGETGLTGNGIEKFETKVDEISKETTITVSFTDKNMKPVEYKVPLGVSIKAVNSKPNPVDGSTEVYVEFSDGSKSDPFIIPKGEKGDGYETHEIKVNEETGETELILKFENHEPVIVTIPRGNGIKSIIAFDDLNRPGKYILKINYDNGKSDLVEFDKPNTWLQGARKPMDSEGADGDFFFDVAHKTIYTKNNGIWNIVVVLENAQERQCTVKFDLNDPDNNASMNGGLVYQVGYGEYFGKQGNSNLPVPTRKGFIFDGWYLVKTPNASNGAFTDLTPVLSDLELFAKWRPEK